MSDFNANFWSVYVAGVTLVGILACLLLLWITARKKVVPLADNTTGHVWDGDLRESNNPMPRWWVWLFVITIIFGLLYLAAYPGLGSSPGQLGWTMRGQYDEEVAQANKELGPLYAQFTAKKTEELAGDANAMAIGERLFMNNCAQCHGSDARGSKGFPNLSDKDWLHGGTPEKIEETIKGGRRGQMPPMAAALGSDKDVENVAMYVRSLSGLPADPIKVGFGKPKFAACAACHGADGHGNQALGPPNLTDKTWLYGGSADTIMETIRKGRTNTMPAFENFLGEPKVHLLAAYVWGLSNQSAPVAKK